MMPPILRLFLLSVFLGCFLRAEDPPIFLRTGQIYSGGADQLFVVRNERALLTSGRDGLHLWDVGTGFDLGYLPGPAGDPVVPTSRLELTDRRDEVVCVTADQILVLSRVSLEWIHAIDFEGAAGAILDRANNRFIVSRNEKKRNMLYTVDLESGAAVAVARLRGAKRETEDPKFTDMRLLDSGLLVGVDNAQTTPEMVLIDPTDWRLKLTREASGIGDFHLLPGDRMLRFGYVNGASAIFLELHDANTLERIAHATIATDAKTIGTDFDSLQNYDPAGDRVLIQCSEGLVWIDLNDLTSSESFLGKANIPAGFNLPYAAAWLPRRGEFALSARGTPDDSALVRLLAWNPKNRTIRQQFGQEPFVARTLLPLPGQSGFIAEPTYGPAKRMAFDGGKLRVTTLARNQTPTAFTPDGSAALISDDVNERLLLVEHPFTPEAKTRELARGQPKGFYKYLDDLFFSHAGDLIAVLNNAHVAVLARDGSERFRAQVAYMSGTSNPHQGIFSPDDQTLVFEVSRKATPEEPRTRKFVALDAATGEVRWEVPHEGYWAILRAFDDGRFLALDRTHRRLEWRRFSDGGLESERALAEVADPLQWTAYALDAPGERLAISCGGNDLELLDTDTGETLFATRETAAPILRLAWIDGGDLLAVFSKDRFHLWRTADLTEVAQILTFRENSEWVVATSDQRFDATPQAQDTLYFQQGSRVIPLSLLFERAYTPDLLAQRLAGIDLPSPDLTFLPDPPSVVLTVADFQARGLTVEDDDSALVTEFEKIKLRLEARGGTGLVDEVRLFHNGKALDFATRGLTVENDVPDTGPALVREVEVLLLPGDNTFEAVALNTERVESAPSALHVVYDQGGAASGGIELHLVVVGVNQYENVKYNLNYAVPDAQAFRDAVLAGSTNIFTAVHPVFLMNADVSRESVLQALREVAHQAGPRDVLIFYYAGHGVMSQAAEPEFYLVPPAVSQLYGNNALLAEKAISASELRDLARSIPAQKQLFVLDACQSAGALEQVAMRGAAEERAIALLARSTGTYWLTATGSEQFAAEVETLGHGVFTYAVLEAMGGAADGAEGDGQLTVRELDAFLQTRVPDLTREHRGSPQYPASYGFGQDFPLSLIHR